MSPLDSHNRVARGLFNLVNRLGSAPDRSAVTAALSQSAAVIPLPLACDSISFRSYAQPLADMSILAWAGSQLHRVCDSSHDVTILAFGSDVDIARSALGQCRHVRVRERGPGGEVSDLDQLMAALCVDTILYVDLTAALLPSATWIALMAGHLRGPGLVTLSTGLPTATAPIIVSRLLLAKLLRQRALPKPLSSLRGVVEGVNHPADTTGRAWYLNEVCPCSQEEQAKRGWPVRGVRFDTLQDAAVLRHLLNKEQDGKDDTIDLMAAWRSSYAELDAARVRKTREMCAQSPAPPARQPKRRRLLLLSGPSAFAGDKSVLCLLARELVRSYGARFECSALTSYRGLFASRLEDAGVRVVAPCMDITRPNMDTVLSARRLAHLAPSLIHANSVVGLPLLAVIQEHGIPLVQHVHVGNEVLGSLRDQLRFASRIVAVSEFVEAQLLRLAILPETIHVVYNAVQVERDIREGDREHARAALGLERSHKVVLCVARFAPKKRHDVMLEAFDIFARQEPNAILLCVGDASECAAHFEAVKRRAATAAGRAQIRLIPFQGDLKRFYASADVMVSPAEEEALPHVILEAMAVGLPVVGARSGGTPELIDPNETGLLFRPGDPMAAAAAMHAVFSDTDLRGQLSARAKQACVDRFSPGQVHFFL